jgi:uncharacterized protein YoxC
MDTLLMVAVVLTTIAVVAQAGVLIGMYMTSRKLTKKAETLMDDGRRLVAPMETVTSNLKTVSDDLAEAGRVAREQALHAQQIVTETHDTIRGQLYEVRERLVDTVDEARDVIMRPIRQYSAMASGIAAGLRTLFSPRPKPEMKGTEGMDVVETEIIIQEGREFPAA